MVQKNIKSGRKTANINTKKTLKVLSLSRPIVHDTSKTATITWFILVLHWSMDVIYDFYHRLENIGNTITHLAMDQLGRNLAGSIPSRSRHVRHNAVAMATAVALQRTTGHTAVMASEGRTREPILMKFGIQQQIRTTMTVT